MQLRTILRVSRTKGTHVPTETRPDIDAQSYLVSAVRQGQAAVIDTIRTWTTITEQLTRTLPFPAPGVDFAGIIDRAFDVAEQTLAAQHQLARTLADVATRQADIAVETVDTAAVSVEASVDEHVRRVEAAEAELEQPDRERPEQPRASTSDTPTVASARQDRRPDGRTYEERSLEELRERAGELQIEGRSSMNKEELIAALRNHRRSRSAKTEAPDRTPDRRAYEERSIEELRERARELEIEGRSTMSKDELIAALRQHTR
jgi:Rho termination factor, N-terminal domain